MCLWNELIVKSIIKEIKWRLTGKPLNLWVNFTIDFEHHPKCIQRNKQIQRKKQRSVCFPKNKAKIVCSWFSTNNVFQCTEAKPN